MCLVAPSLHYIIVYSKEVIGLKNLSYIDRSGVFYGAAKRTRRPYDLELKLFFLELFSLFNKFDYYNFIACVVIVSALLL